MKKVLITGATGYLGSQLSDFLVKRDYNVTGLDTGFLRIASFIHIMIQRLKYRT